MARLDYFSGQFSNVLLTSIVVATAQEQTVASLGTADGRLIQVGGQGARGSTGKERGTVTLYLNRLTRGRAV